MATPLTDQREVVDFLSRLESYGLQKGAVECYRTHGAMVFLAGDRAYKLKRAVRYPYMDYSTPERRFAMCERELAVNRHAAPMLYLGVQPIVRTEECALCFGAISDKLAAIDWVVVMRRFEQENLFGEMQRAGKLTRLLMCSLAEVIVDFHRGAEVHRDYGGVVGIRTVIDENTDILTARIGQPFSAERVATLATRFPVSAACLNVAESMVTSAAAMAIFT
jgi:aminoglycoside phosphotransferase family enzyme